MVKVVMKDRTVWEKQNDAILREPDFTEGADANAGVFTPVFFYTVTRGEMLVIKSSSLNSEVFMMPYGFDLQNATPVDVGDNTLVQIVHMDGSGRQDIQIIKEGRHGDIEQTTLQRDLLNYFVNSVVVHQDQRLVVKANPTGEIVDVSQAGNAFFFRLGRWFRLG